MPVPRCPVCGRMLSADDALSPHRPFCSLRCRQVDLVRWSEGKYKIVELHQPEDEIEPGEETDDSND